MTVDVARFDDLDAVADDAAGALGRAAQPSLFSRLEWFRLIRDHCPPEGKLCVLRGRDGGRSAWLFLAENNRIAQAYTTWYTLRYDAIGAAFADVLTPLCAALRRRGIAQVELAPIEKPEPLAAALRAAGWRVFVREETGNWRTAIQGMDFETYWAARPGQLRNTAKRRANSAGLDIEIHGRFDARAWADYEAVYRASWKPAEGSFPFLRALAEQEGAAGMLRLGVARKNGEPVATQFWLVENGAATILKLAYAEAAKSLSPGTVLSMEMFRRAIDVDRVRVVDYGVGDDAYKKDWMTERRTFWRIKAFNPTTLPGLIGAARAAAGAIIRSFRVIPIYV